MVDFLIELVVGALESALLTLVDYLSLHVLLCLIPAFFIAGALTYFVPKEFITKYLGKEAKWFISYPMSTIAGFLLAVCSCTVLPLFVSIYKRGAGLGPAITFLFVAPAINILALTYTGTLIGMDIALARGLIAIIFAILIGMIMAFIFKNENNNIDRNPIISNVHESNSEFSYKIIIILVLFFICSILLAFLDNFIIEELFLLIPILLIFQTPVTLQVIIFITGLLLLVLESGINNDNRFNLLLWLVYILMTGTSQIKFFNESITILEFVIVPEITNMVAKVLLVSVLIICLVILVIRKIDPDDIEGWLMETKIFVRSILPLIIVGVTIAGFIKFFIPTDIVGTLVGRNTVLANLIGVLFGVFMYFPTLMEVPIAKIFLELGMARGPLLAYLLADPELSIQSILVTRKYLGDRQNTVYVVLVTVFSVIAGLIFGLLIGSTISLW